TAEEFVADMEAIAALGINVLGGCCGTTPEFIARLHQALAPGQGVAAREATRT
ncbi:MAG: homocysteine S-methyltransferase family protein, partial [Candidatus Polarisedimenticolia bacterium]